jgi:hypothetical protein
MDNGLPLALIAQLDGINQAQSKRAVEEIRARIENGEVELRLPFLSALSEHAASVNRPTWSLRLLTETIWFIDDTIGFLFSEPYWSSPEGDHGFIMSALRDITSKYSSVAKTNDHEWMTTHAYASGLLSRDQPSLQELNSLRDAECPTVRDTAAISRALRAHLGDAQAYTEPEARLASVLEGGFALRELTDDVLLSSCLPYQGLHGGGVLGKHLVWFRGAVAIAEMADDSTYRSMIARIAEFAPAEIQRRANELPMQRRK